MEHRIAAINPPLRAGQRVLCAVCATMTNRAVAVLSAPCGTFVCAACLPLIPYVGNAIFEAGAAANVELDLPSRCLPHEMEH